MTVVCLSRNQHHHFASLYAYFNVIEIDEWNVDAIESIPNIELLITPSCDWFEAINCINWARTKNIPVLYLPDGIIEWRHEWENPAHAAGNGIAFNQYVNVDKIACLGYLSARTISGWGNIGKCEVVGVPRFDHYLQNPVPIPPSDDSAKNLLIMTANTPGFTSEQLSSVQRALIDIKSYVESNNTTWKPIWRLGKNLKMDIQFEDGFPQLHDKPLRDVLAQAHAVVTTPSTVILEAMLSKRPTAVLDYTNSPAYIQTAWSITAQEHIAPALSEMFAPPASKLHFQNEVMHNVLECNSLSLPRLVAIIKAMIQSYHKALEDNEPLKFATRILDTDINCISSDPFNLGDVYPNHPTYANQDLISLQHQIVFYEQEIKELKRQNRKLYNQSVVSTLLRKVLRKV